MQYIENIVGKSFAQVLLCTVLIWKVAATVSH